MNLDPNDDPYEAFELQLWHRMKPRLSQIAVLVAFVGMAVAAMFSSCACKSLDAGADPLVVRVEQAERIAFATFDAFLRIERQQSLGRDAHAVAEWLRSPVGGSPRGIALLESLDTVKRAYKLNRGDRTARDNLIAALASVESALAQAQKHLNPSP